jgi:hypothetical protein
LHLGFVWRDIMQENNSDNSGIDELTLEDEQPPIIEEAVAPEEISQEQIALDPIYVPVENLGIGVVNALADMVGGLVGLKGSAETTIKKGVQIIKDQVSQANIPNSAPNDGAIVEPEQAEYAEPEQVIAVEPTPEQAIAVEPTPEQAIAVEPTPEQLAQHDADSKI